MSENTLFNKKLKVINIGLESFADSLRESGVETVSVDFKPPRIISDPKLKSAIEKLKKNLPKIEEANREAVKRVMNSKIFLIGIGKAVDVIPGMHNEMILHAGPPIAEEIASSGRIEFSPCHHHNTVGPMAGIVSPSMPVFILINKEYKNKAYCTLNEGLGKVLRYGAYSKEVIEKLKWMETELAPALKIAIEESCEIDLKNIIAQALHMGDELHNRNKAGTSLFLRTIAPYLVRKVSDSGIVERVLKFIDSNDHFFLNLSMPTCKASLDAASNIKYSSMVIAMARNGTEFGIRVSGTGDEWFTTKADVPDGLFFPGYSKEDANPDIGDSAITETGGIGGFAIASAPAIVQFVGGTPEDALNYSQQMYKITIAENNMFTIPYLNFKGTPTGIDALKVVETGILPVIDTGIAHKEPGIGQVGAGVLPAPMEVFEKAVIALSEKL